MDLQHFMNKLTQVREHLGPLQARLSEAERTAPTDELKKMAGDLTRAIAESYDQSVAEIKNMLNIYAEENGKVEQALRDIEAATDAAKKYKDGLNAAAGDIPTTQMPAFDPSVLERLKAQLLQHVGIVQAPVPSRVTASGQHFADWVDESLAIQNSMATLFSHHQPAASPSTAARFDSWLHDSIQSLAAQPEAASALVNKTDPANDQREWEKLLGG